tara:strand:- start:1262 stop:1453 length:192 start_codon:yes stop_codon:yes gene_type:complete
MRKNDINKVVVWRVLSLTLGFAMTYMYLREIRTSLELVIIINIVMTIVHYFFEGWWRKINENR